MCDKIRYKDEYDALRNMLRVNRRWANRMSRPELTAVYFCKKCKGWHTTSSDLNPKQEAQMKRLLSCNKLINAIFKR
jgi:hypothetical protein